MYRMKHSSSVAYTKRNGYKVIIPRWYAMAIGLKDKDIVEWDTDGNCLRFTQKVREMKDEQTI